MGGNWASGSRVSASRARARGFLSDVKKCLVSVHGDQLAIPGFLSDMKKTPRFGTWRSACDPIENKEDTPIVQNDSIQGGYQITPMGFPCAFFGGANDLPGDRNGTSPDDHPHGQDRKPLTQGRGIQGNDDLCGMGFPPWKNPSQEWGKTGLDRARTRLIRSLRRWSVTGLVAAATIPIPHAFPDMHGRPIQQHGEKRPDGRETRPLGHNHSNTPPC